MTIFKHPDYFRETHSDIFELLLTPLYPHLKGLEA